MVGDNQALISIALTLIGVGVGLLGWLLAMRRLRPYSRQRVIVSSTDRTDSSIRRYLDSGEYPDWAWWPKNYWVRINLHTAGSKPSPAGEWDPMRRSHELAVRVPVWTYLRSTHGTQLDLLVVGGSLQHPFYRVRWITVTFGAAAAVLLINGVGPMVTF